MDVLSALSDMLAEGRYLDVCITCHANAICDDKWDGSGKVCSCKYGFIGNGRTYCQDKDECAIGAIRICGAYTTCHNTYGSYYCTCQAGFSPSNNMTVFIPNDGTHCQDVDECEITGLCGDGGYCRNLEGTFECRCQLGYQVHNGVEPFHPHRSRAFCEEVDCGFPPAFNHAHMLWNKSSRMGSEVLYQCNSGYHNVGMGNVSTCTAAGRWETPSLLCEETLCGRPTIIEHTEQVWNNNSSPGSTVLYFCKEGFSNKGGHDVSICNENGQWTLPTLSCAMFLMTDMYIDKLQFSIQNILYDLQYFEKQRVKIWRAFTLFVLVSLLEIKPAINHLFVLNEKCVYWKAEKYDEDTEVYKVTYTGSRDYQRSFHDNRKRFLSSKADQHELCLNLLPATNYSISITAVSARFTATITTNTSLTVPPAPVVYYREFETPVPTLRLHRRPDTLDPISLYQVFVLPAEGMIMFDCSSAASSLGHITAQIAVGHVGTQMDFTVGDGLYYGGFFNEPLGNGRNYYIILRAVSQWKTVGAAASLCVN
uniref:Sushi domain containing 1 n=1 Tax=Sparus aurata TaxID=8175 RepID=A0A671XQ42_SPAAU